MAERSELAAQFEANRAHLRSVAYRMLGSLSEAEDAVQEAWLRLSRADTTGVENLGGWLTTVVARVCLDLLRARKARREEPDDATTSAPRDEADGPESDVVLADSVGVALLVILETLAPAERLAFVLHDMFDLPFEEIAEVVGCSPAAARQLASRARRRVQGASTEDAAPDPTRRRAVVDAFLTASRNGDLTALLALLAPDVELRPDRAAVEASAASRAKGTPKLIPARGAATVASSFSGRAQAAQPALIDGEIGAVWAPGGVTRVAFLFTIANRKIAAIDVVADPEKVQALDVEILGA